MRRITKFFESADDIFRFCRHSNLTRLFTIEGQTYKVCVDCSRHIFYSPETMLPLRRRELRPERTAGGSAASRP